MFSMRYELWPMWLTFNCTVFLLVSFFGIYRNNTCILIVIVTRLLVDNIASMSSQYVKVILTNSEALNFYFW